LAAARSAKAAACALHPSGASFDRQRAKGLAAASKEWRTDMLWTIFVILIVMWLLGMVSSYTMGGFIHLLLVLAIAVVLINIIQGRRPV
jgi:hypothetical protein